MKSIGLPTSPDCTKEVKALVGVPYSTMNCWDLVRAFYMNVFDIELKHYFEEMPKTAEAKQDLIFSAYGDFKQIERGRLEFGDLISFQIRGLENHIGVYLERGKFLHSSQRAGSCVEKLTRWSQHVASCHRLEKGNK